VVEQEIDWVGIWKGYPFVWPVGKVEDGEVSLREEYGGYFWRCGGDSDDYARAIMDRLRLQPDWSVLVLGPGAADLAVELAGNVRSVTAHEESKQALEAARQQAQAGGLANIAFVDKPLGEALASGELAVHDVVVSSRLVDFGCLGQSEEIAEMDSLAARSVYLVFSDDLIPFEASTFAAVGRKYALSPWFPVVANLLWPAGIATSVERLRVRMRWSCDDVEEAVDKAAKIFERRGQPVTPSETEALRDHFSRILRPGANGKLQGPERWVSLALVWWMKHESPEAWRCD
jgi:hypothetical protein